MIMRSVLCKHESCYLQPAKFSLPWPRPFFRGWNKMHAFIFLSLSSLQYIRFCPWDDRVSWQLCKAVLLYASSCLYSSFLRYPSCNANAPLSHWARSMSRWELQYEAFTLEGRARPWCQWLHPAEESRDRFLSDEGTAVNSLFSEPGHYNFLSLQELLELSGGISTSSWRQRVKYTKCENVVQSTWAERVIQVVIYLLAYFIYWRRCYFIRSITDQKKKPWFFVVEMDHIAK